MLIYPNQMSFPIMEDGGVPPPPQGMLTVKVLRADKLKGSSALDKLDPFVEVSQLSAITTMLSRQRFWAQILLLSWLTNPRSQGP